MKKARIFLLILIAFLILFKSEIVIKTVINTTDTFKNKIFPSLFPFFIISELLINYGFVDLLRKKLSKIMITLFKINPNCAFILIMGMLSGFPSSSKYTKDLYLNNQINEKEATKILTFTHFSNPLFIIGGIGYSFLKSKKVGFIILIFHYISNLIIGLIFRSIIDTPYIKNNKNNNIIEKEFSKVLKDSIISSFNTLFLILGTMIIFLCLTNILNEIIPLNPYLKGTINGILEMTGGINSISSLNISLKNKAIIIGMIISFGGLSVHMQIKSILSDTPIKYYPFLIARILHSGITGLLIYLFYDLLI